MTWYQRKICTSSGMLRNSSVHALPSSTSHLFGAVRRMPISEPTTSATTSAHSATESVQPQADIIQSQVGLPAAGVLQEDLPVPLHRAASCCSDAGRPKEKRDAVGPDAALSQHKQAPRPPASGLAWGLARLYFFA